MQLGVLTHKTYSHARWRDKLKTYIHIYNGYGHQIC